MYEKAKELIKDFEGFREIAYKCPAGIWTIGYGWTHGVKEGDTITEEKASELVEQEVIKIAEQVKDVLSEEVFAKLTENQVCALIDFVYNLGLGNFKESTLCKMIKNGQIMEAGNQFERWVKAGGKVLPGLVKRREAEKELWYA